jgi:hypothetical protein
MCSRESLPGAWIDPWMCSLVVDDPRCVLGPLDVFWGTLILDQVILGCVPRCDDV